MTSVCEAPTPTRTVRIKLASTSEEREATRRLRRAVFCDEQGIFEGDDLDQIDQLALPIAAVLSMPGRPDEVVGTVRIHETEPGIWYGSRLAVAHSARRIGSVGSGLIRLAGRAPPAHRRQNFFGPGANPERPPFPPVS